ncbi:MAG: hypothetical protein PWR03_1511 [Tenuifilum sp.]|uniref:Mpv17/PMP22 family protein n=1 Tax=Tenuifilum sp. TaxID=2760880 RepID=UPI0024AB9A17|nr:Mpv17/PMP22 family protein [Tenuifilum sp.]MDI3527328.1 hypothetical protein [Tenuifilum sp.]
MKRNDFYVIAGTTLFLLPFFASETIYSFYVDFNANHGMIMSFIKFALLATFGEAIGLRIRTGNYNQPGFGLMPRAIVWGLLGLTIKLAFVLFASGVPTFLSYMGLENATQIMKGNLSAEKILVAFCISLLMNVIYAPVMMTLHKITDTHIMNHGGKLSCLLKPIQFGKILGSINWEVQWGFVFAKTIPFFWIPAHTITFLLPADFQVLFAALLSVALGIFLAIASLKGSGK